MVSWKTLLEDPFPFLPLVSSPLNLTDQVPVFARLLCGNLIPNKTQNKTLPNHQPVQLCFRYRALRTATWLHCHSRKDKHSLFHPLELPSFGCRFYKGNCLSVFTPVCIPTPKLASGCQMIICRDWFSPSTRCGSQELQLRFGSSLYLLSHRRPMLYVLSSQVFLKSVSYALQVIWESTNK